jgi:hypothetical protein
MRVNGAPRRFGGGHASLLWTPQNDIDLYGGLWWDAADVADGSVSALVSRCGKGHQLIQATGASQPTKSGGVGTSSKINFDGGDSLARAQATNVAVHTKSNTVPDSAFGMSPGATGKGFTCTGFANIPGTNYFWIGNHGDKSAGHDNTGPWDPSLMLVYRDPATGVMTKIQEFGVLALIGAGTESIQGVTFDTSDNTLWFAIATGTKKGVYHVTQAGVLLSDTITATWAPNGIAYDPRDDGMWIGRESSDGNGLEKRSCSTGAVTMASINPGLSNADILLFDTVTHELLLSYGPNGAAGNIQVYNAEAMTSLVNYGSILLPTQCDTTEGVAIRLADLLINVNDGFYHTGASLLNAGVEARCMPPCPLQFSINTTLGLVGGTTGTDCFLECGTPLSGPGWGLYPTSATGLNLIVNTGASGTSQQATLVGVVPSMTASARLVDCYIDNRPSVKSMTMYVDGTLIGTQSLSACQGGIMTAGTLRFGTASDVRPITGDIYDVALVAGQSNRVNMEGYRANRRALTGNLPANHLWKNAAPTP